MNFSRRKFLRSASLAFLFFSASLASGRQAKNYAIVKPGESLDEIVREAAAIAPSPRQLVWQRREFIAFAHFGMNTFTEREWGLGNESPSTFNPTDFDARQWVKAIRAAGMKLLILTAKHHDGFCLWPSRYTDHTVRNSPWKNGKGDVVREVADACREAGIAFGVYLSPWDRHEKSYGDSPRYNEYFCNQLRELLTDYGEIAEVWFDGASGEGPNGRKQIYDWPSYYKIVRELQPNAVIAIMGPDARWVGTESGYGRETEWSVIPNLLQVHDSTESGSARVLPDTGFSPKDLMGADLGSREKLRGATSLMWYPAETDVSIRPGWFYEQVQDKQVKTPVQLVDIYYSSVGRNSVLLLNIPPDKRGRIADADIRSLMGMRKILDQTFKSNLAAGARVIASSETSDHKASFVIEKGEGGYWTTRSGVDSAFIEFQLVGERSFDRAMLQEEIGVGQRIESFSIEAWNGRSWQHVVSGTTIGYKRLLRFPVVTTSRVRLVIVRSRAEPTLAAFGLFKASS